jgi:transcriptional regulator with XRE-family HTH domain
MIGKRLKELREEKGVYQKDLADYLNLTQQTISLYESNSREPEIDILTKISEFFDCSVDYILGLTNIRKYYTVPASKFVDQIPEGPLKEFVKKHGDKILLDLARKIDDYKLEPQHLADLIDMLGRIQAAKEKQ